MSGELLKVQPDLRSNHAFHGRPVARVTLNPHIESGQIWLTLAKLSSGACQRSGFELRVRFSLGEYSLSHLL
jgi:hypothetical protein